MISSRIRYATRALVYLALRFGGAAVPLREIAAAEEIPEKYLEAIFSSLRRGRLVDSVKGKHGGYALVASPEKMTLLDVVRVFEPGLLTGDMDAGRIEALAWKDVETEVVEKLKAITLAKIADQFRRQDNKLHYAI